VVVLPTVFKFDVDEIFETNCLFPHFLVVFVLGAGEEGDCGGIEDRSGCDVLLLFNELVVVSWMD
jgi:hypothetical protein